jgi:hypothetical protein
MRNVLTLFIIQSPGMAQRICTREGMHQGAKVISGLKVLGFHCKLDFENIKKL